MAMKACFSNQTMLHLTLRTFAAVIVSGQMNGNEVWFDQPSPDDLVIAIEHEPAVAGDDVIAMVALDARQHVPCKGKGDRRPSLCNDRRPFPTV
jgi:hypothetical protein